MKLCTTTEDFSHYTSSYYECIKHVAEAGFRYIDLSQYIFRPGDDLLDSDDWKENAKKIKAYGDSLGVQFVQSHSPGGLPLDTASPTYERLMRTTKRSIEVCGVIGIPNIVVHTGYVKGMTKEEYLELNRAFYKTLVPYMEASGVNVLCENGPLSNCEGQDMMSSGKSLREFINYMDHPMVHACWDTGHANMDGNQYEHIVDLGDELYALHINDNRGTQDEHIPPYFGTVNMDEIMSALVKIGYDKYFTFEATRGIRPANCWIGNRRKFERDTRLAEPTLYMHKQLEHLMYTMGAHFLKTYDCFEE